MRTSACFVLAALAVLCGACGKTHQPSSSSGAGGSAAPAPTHQAQEGSGQPLQTDSGAPSNAAATPANCAELADRACTALRNCHPFALSYRYGDLQLCAAKVQAACTYFTDKGRPLDMEGCANALAAANCQGLLSAANVPKICLLPRGPKAAGEACGADSTCQSLLCDKKEGCGTCVPRAKRGGSCAAPQECATGLLCDGTTCVEVLAPGEACTAARPYCSAGSSCVDDKCRVPGSAGASCAPLEPCDEAQGYACLDAVCAKAGLVAEGEACTSSAATRCGGGLYCAGAISHKVCAPKASQGQSCTDRPCQDPLNCVNGVCTFEEFDTCGEA